MTDLSPEQAHEAIVAPREVFGPRLRAFDLEREHYNEPSPELADDLCPKCGGHGTPQARHDSFGNWDPCDACEGTGLVDFEEGRPDA
jgi:hypothetical protein